MFKSLSYFYSLEQDLQQLTDNSQKLSQLLVHAYSPPEQSFCSFQEQVQQVMNQQDYLQGTISALQQQLRAGTFVPHKIDSYQLSQILPEAHTLPEWFGHVLEKEHEKHKPSLDSYARSLIKMHQLQEKGKAMSEEKKELQLLYRRTLGIEKKNKGAQDIDLIQEVIHLKNRVDHVKSSYQQFCRQITEKIAEFVRQVAEKTSNFGRSQKPATIEDSFKAQINQPDFKRQPKVQGTDQYLSIRSNQDYRSASQRDWSSSSQKGYPVRYVPSLPDSKSPRYKSPPAQEESYYSKAVNFNQPKKHNSPAHYIPNQRLTTRENTHVHTCHRHPNEDPYLLPTAYQPALSSRHCPTHDIAPPSSNSHHHKHTCNRGLLRAVNSADNLATPTRLSSKRIGSPVSKYDYRKYASPRAFNDYLLS